MNAFSPTSRLVSPASSFQCYLFIYKAIVDGIQSIIDQKSKFQPTNPKTSLYFLKSHRKTSKDFLPKRINFDDKSHYFVSLIRSLCSSSSLAINYNQLRGKGIVYAQNMVMKLPSAYALSMHHYKAIQRLKLKNIFFQ